MAALGTDPMDSMANQGGDMCPCCGKRPATVMAVSPIIVGGEIILPHCFAVCLACHKKQYVEKYGYTPEEAPSKVPPRRLFIADNVRAAVERQIKLQPGVEITSDVLFELSQKADSKPAPRPRVPLKAGK